MRYRSITVSFFIFVMFFVGMRIVAQSQFTQYDNLPGVQKSLKPAYSSQMPDWGKMLYSFPINFDEVNALYSDSHESKNNVRNALTRYYKVWRRAVQPFVNSNGQIILPDLDKYYLAQKLRQESIGKRQEIENRNGAEGWSFVGPKQTFWLKEDNNPETPSACSWQVNVYSFDIAALDKNIIIAGTETGFLNKSIDNGLTWNFVAKEYPFGSGITSVAMNPTDPNTILVSSGNQIHKSTDGGITFLPKLGAARFSADVVKYNPNNPQQVAAASQEGLYISNDGGETWTRKWNFRTWDVEFHPTNSSVVYGLSESAGLFIFLNSINGGASFQQSNAFPVGKVAVSGGLLAVTPDNPDLVLAGLLSDAETPQILKGIYSNNAWQWTTLALGKTPKLPMDNWQGYYDFVLEISPINQDIVYTGTSTLFRSVDGGISFTPIGGYDGIFPLHPDIQDLKVLNNGDVWVATDGGMNYSTDNFSSIPKYRSSVNGLVGSDFWGFDQGWNEDLIVGGRYHNGNTAIADFYQDKALRMGGAESPTGWVVQGKSRHVAFDDLGGGWILPKKAEDKYEGNFIFTKFPNMDEYGGRRGNLVHHPNYSGTLYLGSGKTFWRSTDFGANWEMMATFPENVRYLQISHSNPDFIYVDIVDKGLYKSEDGGKSFIFKPALTSPPGGDAYWGGKHHFDISPYDPNKIYVCQQNGIWSSDLGKVLMSSDGGDSWHDISTNITGNYLKAVLVQPGINQSEVLYLFTIPHDNLGSNVYFKRSDAQDWTSMSDEYPVGMIVNMPKIFYKDSKIRVAGTSGVWEHKLKDTLYEPIIQPWVEQQKYKCILDTVRFDDHSIIDHEGASWTWNISPMPLWVDDLNIRNPRVVLGSVGNFSVTMTITKNGIKYTKSIPDFVNAISCPSLSDCTNPASVPKNEWKLISVTSQEELDPGLAVMAFDGNPSTIWHTRWTQGADTHPHEMQINLNRTYEISEFMYLARQIGVNGNIKKFELYLSLDSLNWGEPVLDSVLSDHLAPQYIKLAIPKKAKFMKLIAKSEHYGQSFAAAAELGLVGCYAENSSVDDLASFQNISAYPVPSLGIFEFNLPDQDIQHFDLYDAKGLKMKSLKLSKDNHQYSFDLSELPSGVYYARIVTTSKRNFHMKLVKI
ncbi:MAG: discoidin domain-containing protein [Saprospiraceae bacterium]|nr:discoidin domain-containing protein [Saprospiraceae bacterium]